MGLQQLTVAVRSPRWGGEAKRVWVIVAFSFPPGDWQRLGDTYRVEASFTLCGANDVSRVPAGALFRDGDGWAAFALAEGRAVKHRVEIGQRNGLSAQDVAGLEVNDQVIVHPDDRVREGVGAAAR